MDITKNYIDLLGMSFDPFTGIYNNLQQFTTIETGWNFARSWEETNNNKILSGGNFDQNSAIYFNQEALKFWL